ncbi:PTS transporter subunit EIIC [Lactobacillus sp. ESL0785]|uniref:PTS transporter subunit EIIC n=1 Tax=Lactobacillus sp. ESL0785 TaxID=2983232 RepID=UPI0023F8282C|nr:PTS transporter subunit EIIC [Lactobacillus sp. ESL0785]WEV71051.1 PTS transporter subunit EIIC [Lactobacillus sp. ESL0785]
MSKDYQEMAKQIDQAVGGSGNVASVTHCMTRLRFNLKDMNVPKDDEVKKIGGVLGVARSGGQYQIVIGQTVNEVYDAVVAEGNLTSAAPVNENLDEAAVNNTEKRTWKSVGNTILNKIAGSLTPLIPMLIAASMFKMLVAVLGPTMLNVISVHSDLYQLFTFVGDAGFYFFPIAIGYTAAKQFNTSPILGIFLGAIMLDPGLVKIVAAGKPFTVYGLPMHLTNYASTVVPILLSVWIMSYIERFFNKHITASLRTIFAPTLTIVIMLPLSLCILGPLGGFLGEYVSKGIISFGELGGIAAIIGVGLIGAFWELLVMTGMHLVLISAMITIVAQTGHDNFILLGSIAASMAVAGMSLGASLRLKDKKEKSLAFSYFIANLIGGVTEPALYGLAIKYRRPFIGMMLGGFAGGIYAAITHVSAYVVVPVANFMCLSGYVGGSTTNLINGVISGVIALLVAAIATYLIGVEPKTKN